MKVCPVCERKFPDKMTLCSADASVLKRLDDPLLGQTLAGKYKIEKLIKMGGMGSVYRGRHVLMDKTVAIKVLRPSLAGDDAVVARFSREAKAASKISHPHAVSVTDFGEAENGVVFLIMEYLNGRTLKEAITSEGPLSLGRAVEIVRQVAGALDAAHGQGVIHRDLKSENIMLVSHNGDEWAKVLDFGIAKILQPVGSAADAEITQANLVVGTPQYMSPEQCSQSGALDARSDVYSLGIIVHEMLTGKLPFTGESATVVMMKQVQDTPPSVLESQSQLPAAVDRVIKRALAKQPIDRFQSAGELSAAFADAASEEAAEAPVLAGVAATAANTPLSMPAAVNDDLDEVTVVRPRTEVAAVSADDLPHVYREAPAVTADRFNPWRIIVPAAIALVVVFAAVFLLTQGTSPTDPNQLPLNADPNSTPVQPTGTPTGLGESDVRPIAVATPTPAATQPVASPTRVPAVVTGDFGNENTNSGRGNRNSNQPARPTPQDEPPPPPPPRASPTVRTLPTPGEATASPGQP
ncbi:MAG TPA: protein kinase [Pyrinomonadaceae bacterium]|nr:protein kinase [Pyrinomonadaceae bacterium]